MPDALPTRSDVGSELVERLRGEHGWNEDGGNGFDPEGYTAALEKHAAEGIRVNVGLMAENAELKRRLRDA